jgi:hypothetical protein
MMMNQAGFMPGEKVRRSLELFAKEVYPAIRDLGEPKLEPAGALAGAAAAEFTPMYGLPGDQP